MAWVLKIFVLCESGMYPDISTALIGIVKVYIIWMSDSEKPSSDKTLAKKDIGVLHIAWRRTVLYG